MSKVCTAIIAGLLIIMKGEISYAKSVIPNIHYARNRINNAAQELPILNRIQNIIFPTVGFPSLVQRGGSLAVLLQIEPHQASVLERLAVKNYKAILSTRGLIPNRDVQTEFSEYYANFTDLWDNRTKKIVPFLEFANQEVTSREFEASIESTQIKEINNQYYVILQTKIPENLPPTFERAFDLQVIAKNDSGDILIDDAQPHSVGLLNSNQRFRFAHLADPQINDLEIKTLGQFNPDHPDLINQKLILKQAIKELNLLKPDFAIISGDMVTGSSFSSLYLQPIFALATMVFPTEDNLLEKSAYWQEYNSAVQLLRMFNFPSFCATGNHDGFAAYRAINSTQTHYQVRFSDTFYGPEEQAVLYDGKHFWQKTFGPLYYSFDVGSYHFVAIDTYDLRRFFRNGYASPLIPNHGGYISKSQMAWLEADLQAATSAGKTIFLFGHHDPRAGTKGLLLGKRKALQRGVKPLDIEIRINLENYLSDPLFTFQEWVSNETDVPDAKFPDGTYDPAAELLRLIETYNVTHYFLGHVHADYTDTIDFGSKKVLFIHTTSLSAYAHQARNVKTEGNLPQFDRGTLGPGLAPQWGYRLYEVSNDGLKELSPTEQSVNRSFGVGKIRVQVGFDPKYYSKVGGYFSDTIPHGNWLPYAFLVAPLWKDRSDKLLSAFESIDPVILSESANLSFDRLKFLWDKPYETLRPVEKSAIRLELERLIPDAKKALGTRTEPKKIFVKNQNNVAIEGVLEVPNIGVFRLAQARDWPSPTKKDAHISSIEKSKTQAFRVTLPAESTNWVLEKTSQ
ncbi:MAG: metallophosphoesterase [Bacteriovoracia bacterium]